MRNYLPFPPLFLRAAEQRDVWAQPQVKMYPPFSLRVVIKGIEFKDGLRREMMLTTIELMTGALLANWQMGGRVIGATSVGPVPLLNLYDKSRDQSLPFDGPVIDPSTQVQLNFCNRHEFDIELHPTMLGHSDPPSAMPVLRVTGEPARIPEFRGVLYGVVDDGKPEAEADWEAWSSATWEEP